jgi:hypothetical protein
MPSDRGLTQAHIVRVLQERGVDAKCEQAEGGGEARARSCGWLAQKTL